MNKLLNLGKEVCKTLVPIKNEMRFLAIVTVLFCLYGLFGCAPLQWAVTQDPTTGVVPAVAALPGALDGGLAGILGGGGVFGVLAFVATYGKTLRRLWMDHKKKTAS